MGSILEILKSGLWLIVRFFKRRDAKEPERKRDEIDKAVTEHDEKKVNILLDDGIHHKPTTTD